MICAYDWSMEQKFDGSHAVIIAWLLNIQRASARAPSVFASPLSGRGMRLGCLFACLLVLWGLIGCGAHRPAPDIRDEASPAAKKIVESAYSQLGTRYRSGGNSPDKGFDCSGLVQWAYSQQGIAVPRVTTDQARAGRLVAPKEDLLPADILVFKNRQAPRRLHTGLYTGSGRFIHSPGSGESVRVENLSAAYWQKTLIGARRLVQ